MSDLSKDTRALLDLARDAHDPSAADRERVKKALLVAVSTGAVTGASAGASAAATGVASKAAGLTLMTKLAASLAVVTTIAAVTVVATHAPPAPRAQRLDSRAPSPTAQQPDSRAPAPMRSARHEPLADPAPIVAPAIPPERVETPPPPRPPVSRAPVRAEAPRPDLASEVALLRASESARRSGDAASALAQLDVYAQRFPHGMLEAEALAARVFALCDLGRADEARPLAERFLRDHAASPLSARVRASCVIE